MKHERLKLAADRFKCARARVSCAYKLYFFVIYFKFCCFKAVTYITLNSHDCLQFFYT